MKRLLFILALVCAPLAYGQGGVPASPIYFSGPTGRPLAGATVTVCTSAGTGLPCSPLASIFTNAGLTIASPNPVTTDGNGNIPVIFAAPGVYILSVTGSGITPTLVTATVAGTGAGNVTTSGSNVMIGTNTFTGPGSIAAFTAINGCQYVNANQTFAQALAAASNPGCIYVTPGTYTVGVSATVPAGVTLVSVSGGLLSISSGVTLTINGGIIAPPVQIFTYTVPAVATVSTTSESSSTVTITTSAPHGFSNGQSVLIQNVTVAGYNVFAAPISGVTSTTFQYTDTNTGLGNSSAGTAQALPVTFSAASIGSGLPETWFPGADIGARTNAAFAALPTMQQLPNNVFESSPMFAGAVLIPETGAVTLSTLIDIRSHRVKLVGPGRDALTINSSLTGASIRITDNVFGNYGFGADVRGFNLQAVSPGANSVGIEAGDMWGLRLSDLTVQGFNGVNGAGIWFNNGQLGACGAIGINCGFIENGTYWDINLYGNTHGWKFSNSTGNNAGFSYGYNHWYRIHVLVPTGGDMWAVDGNASQSLTPTIYHSTLLQMACEPTNSAVTNFTCINLAAQAIMADNTYSWFSENTFGGPVNTPIVLGNNAALTGHGQMDFFSTLPPSFGGSGSVLNVTGRIITTAAQWGPACLAGQIVISAGWGNTANVNMCDGNWESLHIRVIAGGTGLAANPTVTINFPQTNHTPSAFLTWRNPPETACQMNGTGNVANPNAQLLWNNTQTTTAIALTAIFTPLNGGQYDITCNFRPR